jgi:WD40 repeat protein/DNA-directed RNA polymerase specialized sigma24 family protein
MMSVEPERNHSSAYDPFEQAVDADVELAYQLQNSPVDDPIVWEMLASRFAAEVRRMVAGWFLLSGQPRNESEIQKVVGEILCAASQQIDQLRGEISLQNWVYKITIKRLIRYTSPNLWLKKPVSDPSLRLYPELLTYTVQQRRLVWLRYGMNLSLPECADVWGVSIRKLKRLMNGIHTTLNLADSASPNLNCSISDEKLWDYHDGIVRGDERLRFIEHLDVCSSCHQRLHKISEYQQNLSSLLSKLCPLVDISPYEIEDIIDQITEKNSRKKILIRFQYFGKRAWAILIVMLFMITGLVLMLRSPAETALIPQPSPTSSNLPEILPVNIMPEAIFEDNYLHGTIHIYAQDQSEDGKWIVFSDQRIEMGDENIETQEEIYLYDANSHTSRLIISGSIFEEMWSGYWFSPPAISANGSLIVFDAYISDPSVTACHTSPDGECQHVYLYDQQSQELRLLSVGINGTASNGSSYAPAISADGSWVAFWSDATNLVGDNEPECIYREQQRDCVYTYLYEVETGTIQRVNPSASLLPFTLGIERLSLSADGRYLGYTTVFRASDYDSSYSSVYLYDRIQDINIPVDVAPDGTPGNGNSGGITLSADGMLIAFVSESSNLLPDDTNGVADVFLLDRVTGRLERISRGNTSEEPDDASGYLYSLGNYYSIDLSADGNIIAFISMANDLAYDPQEDAAPMSCDSTLTAEGVDCNALYLYDRTRGRTERVTFLRSYGWDMFPALAYDGSTLSYVSFRVDCHPYLCSDVYQYDRRRGFSRVLTQNALSTQFDTWSYAGSIDLPNSVNNAVLFSPDGGYFATANADGNVRVFRTQDTSQISTLQVEANSALSMVVCLSFSPVDSLIAGGTMDGVVYIWDYLDSRRIYSLDGHPGSVIDVFFTADGNQVIAVTTQEVWIWQVGDNHMTRSAQISLDGPRVVDSALSPTGNLLATARQDGTVWLQMLPNGMVLARLGGHATSLRQVAFSGDGTRLLTRGYDGIVNLWEVNWQGFGALNLIPLHSYSSSLWLGDIYISSDGTYLAASRSSQGGIGVWNVNNNQHYDIESTLSGALLAFSPQWDMMVAAWSEGIEIWRGPGWADESYFVRSASNELSGAELYSGVPAADMNLPVAPGLDDYGVSLYDAQDLWQHDLLAPAHLPPEVSFKGAYFGDYGSVILKYSVIMDSQLVGELTIIEQPLSDDLSQPITIGQSAILQEVKIASIAAEYVRGDWFPETDVGSTVGVENWVWRNDSESQRLCWEQAGLLLEIYYQDARPNLDVPSTLMLPGVLTVETGQQGVNELDLINMDTLVQIAYGFQSVEQTSFSGTYLYPYTVQEGDTCTAIALLFSTTVEGIISTNPDVGNCDLIYPGQSLNIPMGENWQIFSVRDLNCDGRLERVEVDRLTNYGYFSGVRLMAIYHTGLYRQVWSWTVEIIPEAIDELHIVSTDICQALLAFHALDQASQEWNVYTWDGTQVRPVDMTYENLSQLLPGNP